MRIELLQNLKKYDRIIRKLQMPKGKVVEVVSSLCSMISAKLFGEDLLLLQVCKRELILVAKLIKRMWIMYEMAHTISLAAAVAAVTPSLV